jgi:hypothetical protein
MGEWRRYRFIREMRKHWIFTVIGTVWFIVGGVSNLTVLLPPERARKVTLYPIVSSIGWRVWVIGFLVLIVAILFESYFNYYRRTTSEIAALKQEVDTKTQEWIAAKQEALDAKKKDLKTHEELVKALSDLAQAEKTISNSSDAFHAEYAKNSALRQELDRFKSNRVKEKWEKLENDFVEVGGGSNMTMIAFWERKTSDGSMVWHLMGGWDQGSHDRFQVVMDEAGQLLLASDYFKAHYSEYAEEEDSISRWLLTLAKELDEPMTVTGNGYTRETGETQSGEISELPRKCALCCARFAAKEKWPAPQSGDN